MSILIFRDTKTACAAAATMIAGQLLERPESVIGVEYSDQVLPVFDSLSAMTENGLLDWTRTTLFQLSELVQREDGITIREKMKTAFLERTGVRQERFISPDSVSENWADSCHSFEEHIRDVGGLDLALFTVHTDGAVLFNGSGPDIAPITHVKFYEGRKTVTLALPSLMQARRLVVLLTGNTLAQAAADCLRGPVNSGFAASLLQLHGAATFLLDEEAAALLG